MKQNALSCILIAINEQIYHFDCIQYELTHNSVVLLKFVWSTKTPKYGHPRNVYLSFKLLCLSIASAIFRFQTVGFEPYGKFNTQYKRQSPKRYQSDQVADCIQIKPKQTKLYNSIFWTFQFWRPKFINTTIINFSCVKTI